MYFLAGKNIVILGGTGTLGRALTLELKDHKPNRLIIFSRDEIKQLEMMEDFTHSEYSFLDFKIGDVRDSDRLNEVINGADFVIHAAAIKHVVMAEKNPGECWKTNVIGTQNVIEACKVAGVRKALLMSTDKAVNPIGVYGKSKLEAEQYWLKANGQKLKLSIVRLGNIIGARGSVFEAFEKQRKTGVIKVTHPEATRFCISQEAAAQFVLSALEKDQEQIFIPDMKAFRVLDLAKKIAPECKIEMIGLRPGDKLHEEIEGVSSEVRVQNLNMSAYGT